MNGALMGTPVWTADNALRFLREELKAKREERAQRIVDRIGRARGGMGGSEREWLKALILEELGR